jgi:hypothetical protein
MGSTIPDDAWYAVVSNLPTRLNNSLGINHQLAAAWKKWYGIMHLMDLPADHAPQYGLMLDSELALYDKANCGKESVWSSLYKRIQDVDRSRRIPAARVSDTLMTTDIMGQTVSGKQYDQIILSEHLANIAGRSWEDCESVECKRLQRQYNDCLFSWWTELPFVNLTIAAKLVASIAQTRPGPGRDWRTISRDIAFSRFEIISYHVWCVLHEGFDFLDVTEITKEALWGSYLEITQKGSRLAELEPMWIGADVLAMAMRQEIAPLSATNPPLLVFHIDHLEGHEGAFAAVKERMEFRKQWNLALVFGEVKQVLKSGTADFGFSCENDPRVQAPKMAKAQCCPFGASAYQKGKYCCREKVDHAYMPVTFFTDGCANNNFVPCSSEQGCVTCTVFAKSSFTQVCTEYLLPDDFPSALQDLI